MKIKVFGPEIDPNGGGICLTHLTFEMEEHELIRFQVELEDGTTYDIQSHNIGGIHYLEVNTADKRSLYVVPEGKKSIYIGSM